MRSKMIVTIYYVYVLWMENWLPTEIKENKANCLYDCRTSPHVHLNWKNLEAHFFISHIAIHIS